MFFLFTLPVLVLGVIIFAWGQTMEQAGGKHRTARFLVNLGGWLIFIAIVSFAGMIPE